MKDWPSSQEIIHLANLTFSASTQTQIDQASGILYKAVLINVPKSYVALEDILIQQRDKLRPQTKKALINLVKVTGQQVLRRLRQLGRGQQQILVQQKNILHAVEHIFDNKKIQSNLKNPIGELYIQLFMLFSYENTARLVSKCRYYYNIRQHKLALVLINAFHHTRISFKYKVGFYITALQITIQVMITLLDFLVNNFQNQKINVLSCFMQTLKQICTSMTFEKYQSGFMKLWHSKNYAQLLVKLTQPQFYKFFRQNLCDILNHILTALGRCCLLDSFTQIVQIIKKVAIHQFKKIFDQPQFSVRQSNCSILNFLCKPLEYGLISCNLSPFELYSKFIYQNYSYVQSSLAKTSTNHEDLWAFISDISFSMDSQVESVQHNKLLMSICRHSQQTTLALKNLIDSFFSEYLPSSEHKNEHSKVYNNKNLQPKSNFWSEIVSRLGLKEILKSILMQTALSCTIFFSSIDFIKKICNIVALHYKTLLEGQNDVAFYTLILLRNYMDDIFDINSASNFKISIAQLAVRRNQLTSNLATVIMEQCIAKKPAFSDVKAMIDIVLESMQIQYDSKFIKLISLIFKHYGEELSCESVKTIVENSFNFWKLYFQYHNEIPVFELIQLLKEIFSITSIKQYFHSFLVALISFTNEHVKAISSYIQDIIIVISIGLKATNSLPEGFQQVIVKFELQINNNQIMQATNSLIKYSNSSNFANWIARQMTRQQKMNLRCILLTHNLIYYSHFRLSDLSIKTIIEVTYLNRKDRQSKFDYKNGKLSLIFLLLLRYRWETTNRILKENDWRSLRETAQQRQRYQKRSSDIPFIEQIYQLIYLQENIYRWKYDIEIFVIQHIELFNQHIKDQMQLAYANVSFLALLMNIVRAQEFIKQNYIDSGSQSDDSICPISNLQRNYRQAKQILKVFSVANKYLQVDYFLMFQRLISFLESIKQSAEWVSKVLEIGLKQQFHQSYERAMKMSRNSPTQFREIRKLKRYYQNQN